MQPSLLVKLLLALILAVGTHLPSWAQSQWQVQSMGTEVSCQVFMPDHQSPTHTVVLVHDQQGIDDPTLMLAQAIVEMGYQVVIPDLKAALTDEGIRSSWTATSADKVSELLDAVLVKAEGEQYQGGKMVVVGIGWGSGQAFELAARSRRPELIVVFGGKGPRLAANCARISAPIYGFYGTAKRHDLDQVNQLTRYMLASSKFFEPVTFGQAEVNFISATEDNQYRIANQNARLEAMKQLQAILLNAEDRRAMR